MLDIDSLRKKVVEKSRDKATGFLSDSFPSLGSAPSLGAMSGMPYSMPSFHWSGMQKHESLAHYKSLKALGLQNKNFYVVRFLPYKNNVVKSVPLIENDVIGWLATDISVPLIQAETDSKRVGHYTTNHVTGNQLSEITVTMLETEDNMVQNSIRKIRKVMFKNDGTFGLPSEYCFWLDVWLYGRMEGMTKPKSASRFLVYPSQATLEASASESDALTIPITFMQARGFMPF